MHASFEQELQSGEWVARWIAYPQWVLREDRSPFKSRSDTGTQRVCISRLKRGAERGVWDRSAKRTFWYTAEKNGKSKYNTAVDN